MVLSDVCRFMDTYRLRLLCLFFHCAQSLGRRPLALSTPSLLTSGLMSRTQIGLLSSGWRLSLALWKVVVFVKLDDLEPRHVMAATWFASGLCCIAFSWLETYWLMLVVWMCDAAFVSFMWPATVKELRRQCSESELGLWWSLFGSGGSLVVSLFPPLLLQTASWLAVVFSGEKWRFVFLLPGLVSVAVAAMFIAVMPGPAQGNNQSQKLSNQQLPLAAKFGSIVCTPATHLLVLCTALGHVLRIVLTDWLVVMTMEMGWGDERQGQAAARWFDLGTMAGVLVSGLLVDALAKRMLPSDGQASTGSDPSRGDDKPQFPSLKKHRHSAMAAATFAFTVGTVWAISNIAANERPVNTTDSKTQDLSRLPLVLGAGGFFLGGHLSLVGVCLLESWPVEYVGAVVGLNGLGAQVGALFSGWPVAYLVNTYSGWEPVLLCLNIAVTLLLVCTITAFWFTKRT